MTVLAVSALASAVSAAPWWDDFPRMVDANSVQTVSDHHGTIVMNTVGEDPTWGTFFQRHGIVASAANAKAFQAAGIKPHRAAQCSGFLE